MIKKIICILFVFGLFTACSYNEGDDVLVNEDLPFGNDLGLNESKLIEEDIEIIDEDLELNESKLNISNENEKVEINEINLEYEGDFSGANGYSVDGFAKIISQGDNRYLRFENFSASNGPDLYVYLSTDNTDEDIVDLGLLKGNIGDQNYKLDLDIDLEKYDNVIIWCKRFSVLFGEAKLE